jgi:hypothetical protein
MRLALLLGLSALQAFAAETWLGVGYGGRRMVSHDGLNWEITAEWAPNGKDDSNNLMSAAFGAGKFIVVGGGGWSKDTQAGHILTSGDGRKWEEVKTLPFRVNPVVHNGRRFLAGGPNRTLWFSDDGISWTQGAQAKTTGIPSWALWFRHAASGNGVTVFMGEAGAKKEFYWCMTSADGTQVDFRADLPQLRALAFGANTFVAVGNGLVMTSADGKAWQKQERSNEEKLDWIQWTGKEFITGGGKTVLTSTDGKNWQPSTLRPPGRVLWTDGTRFITSSWPGKMSFSADGKTWKASPAMTPNGINAVVKAP